MLQEAYGDSALKETQVYDCFREGRETVENDPTSRRQTSSTTETQIPRVQSLLTFEHAPTDLVHVHLRTTTNGNSNF